MVTCGPQQGRDWVCASQEADRQARAVVVNGTLVQYGGFRLEAEPSPSGTARSVDLAENATVVDKAIADLAPLHGSVITLGSGLRQASYTITTAKAMDGDELDSAPPDASRDGPRVYWISDVGPGDIFRIPTAATCAKRDGGNDEHG